jgi:hypothetical protein
MSDVAPSPPTDKRVNESPLAGIERIALLAIARRLPAWVTPDRLTGFGVFGAVLVLLGGVLANHAIGWLWLSIWGLSSIGQAILLMAPWPGCARSSGRAMVSISIRSSTRWAIC